MKRIVLRFVVAAGLVALGGRPARRLKHLVLTSKYRSTHRGRDDNHLSPWVWIAVHPKCPDRNAAKPSFTYSCSGAPRCGGTVQGWVGQ